MPQHTSGKCQATMGREAVRLVLVPNVDFPFASRHEPATVTAKVNAVLPLRPPTLVIGSSVQL